MNGVAIWAGAIGVVAGAIVTGTIQIVGTALARRSERITARRQERKDLYLRSLWSVRKLPRMFIETVRDEHEAVARGEAFEVPDIREVLDPIERATFELRILGKPKIAQQVDSYDIEFKRWVAGLDASLPITDSDEILARLDALEAKIVDLMRRDLG
ncbi:hypothetical protein [Cellulosimicrobium cellulans]|uniref:hypothetical protein n=1 Tax=Cellulosimicrobium cellulans TaxID=1710 RepID=UPI003806E5A2